MITIQPENPLKCSQHDDVHKVVEGLRLVEDAVDSFGLAPVLGDLPATTCLFNVTCMHKY